MIEVIGVRFKKVGKMYYFDPNGVTADKGENVLVETARGVEYGEVVKENTQVEEKAIVAPLKKVVRRATEADAKTVEENLRKEKEALEICTKQVAKLDLDMKLVDVEMTFDRNKLIFYFTSDGRVDFRELVKDLAATFRTRIELRQIGVRDEAKMLNGIGVCGRPLCCATFLGDFQTVSIKMAKEQNLSLNPTKISGICGRLMCCLKYEEEVYEELNKTLPRIGDVISTPDGKGEVLATQVLQQQVKAAVRKTENEPPTIEFYHVDDIKLLKTRKKKQQELQEKMSKQGKTERIEKTEESDKPNNKPTKAENKPEQNKQQNNKGNNQNQGNKQNNQNQGNKQNNKQNNQNQGNKQNNQNQENKQNNPNKVENKIEQKDGENTKPKKYRKPKYKPNKSNKQDGEKPNEQ